MEGFLERFEYEKSGRGYVDRGQVEKGEYRKGNRATVMTAISGSLGGKEAWIWQEANAGPGGRQQGGGAVLGGHSQLVPRMVGAGAGDTFWASFL